MYSQRFWIISESECRRQMSSYHNMASVFVRSRRFWNNSPEYEHSDGAGGCTSVRTVTIALEIFVDRTAFVEGTLNRY